MKTTGILYDIECLKAQAASIRAIIEQLKKGIPAIIDKMEDEYFYINQMHDYIFDGTAELRAELAEKKKIIAERNNVIAKDEAECDSLQADKDAEKADKEARAKEIIAQASAQATVLYLSAAGMSTVQIAKCANIPEADVERIISKENTVK
jgi:uncharacterized coiled-coil protein SlyX